MTEIKHITCIRCPIGCQLTVEVTDGVVTKVEGNLCKRGVEYAQSECVHPVRTLTTTVRVLNGDPLPVRSREPLPKEMIFACMDVMRTVAVTAPVAAGTVVVADICGTGVDMIATASAGEDFD
ncbi:MAG: DUF1667 domain-containing protein [Clostridia bacterium]